MEGLGNDSMTLPYIKWEIDNWLYGVFLNLESCGYRSLSVRVAFI